MTAAAIRPVAIKIDEEIRARVKRLADARHRTSHWLMREAITQYVEREELREAFRQDTLRAWEEYRSTGLHVTADEADAWLAQLRKLKDPATTPAGFVPATQYLALDENEHVVGMTNLRHHLNDYLLAYGGHIGYSVRPSERKNGYASQMLHLTLEKARERGISKVRICCDHYNIASAKTIQSNGGVLEDEMFDSSDGMLTQRYWIENR